MGVAGALAEAAMRLANYPPPVHCGWISDSPKSERNQLGFRGQSIRYSNGDFVVVLLGDSRVEASACAFDWMPEKRIERHLRATLGRPVKAFTLGTRGYGQDQQLLALQRYFETYRADLILVWQCPENDIWNNIFPTHWPKDGMPKPTYWLEDGKLKGPNLPFGQKVGHWSNLLESFGRLGGSGLDRDWEKGHLPQAYAAIKPSGDSVNDEWQAVLDSGILHYIEEEDLASEKSHLAIYFSPPSPRMRYGLELSNSLLSKMRHETEQRGGRLLCFLPYHAPTPDSAGSPNRPVSIWQKKFQGVDLSNRGSSSPLHVFKGKYYMASDDQYWGNVATMNRGVEFRRVEYGMPLPLSGPGNDHENEHAVDEIMFRLAAEIANIPPSGNGNHISHGKGP